MIQLAAAPGYLSQALIDMEVKLLQYTENQPPLIGEGLKSLVAGGGKRIRPLLCLMGVYYGDAHAAYEDVVELATMPELLHLASLIHDDIIDQASARRGVETLHSRFGTHVAVYAGDLVIIQTLNRMLAYYDKSDYMRFSADLLKLVQAEILQMAGKTALELSVKRYLRVIEGKTARLLKLSFEMGAVYSHVAPNTRKKLLRAVHYMGMAFQIKDDCLDFSASQQIFGKPVLQDLKNGYLTLPAILYYRRHGEQYKRLKLKGSIKGQKLSASQFAPDVEKTLLIANRYTQKALALLKTLPEHPLNETFIELANLLNKREH